MKLIMEQWRDYQNSVDLDKELLEEGLKDKITKGLAGLALAGGLGLGMPSKAQAQTPGTISSVERSISDSEYAASDMVKEMLSQLAASPAKDDVGLKVNFQPNDLKQLAKSMSEYASLKGHKGDRAVKAYSKAAINIIKDGIKTGGSKMEVVGIAKESFEQMKKKVKAKKTTSRAQSFETRDNPRLVQQAVFGVFLAAGQGESMDKPMDDLMSKMKRAIKDGSMSKADAKKILKLIPEGPSKMDQINAILGLQK